MLIVGELSEAGDNSDEETLELPIFEMVTISRATDKFCDTNKIGEGGFGPIYKGLLSTGKEIAVKRLSTTSKQGLNEFKSEMTLIAKLQYRNLVMLLGCCIHGEERMLIYEYMPNGSLDSLIFGVENTRSKSLTWRRRLDIIVGIAQGVLYLHRDSRLRIIHRDLKASNVILDCGMNPKISDFGVARTFGGDRSSATTRRVVGTYGYMSPEYVIDGLFSIKSDVFSFGVMILEILSGKSNRRFHHPDHNFYLLGHAWTLWIEGKACELLDPLVEGLFSMSEVLRCIQIGLLCVQKCPKDRPTMSTVLLMLITETIVPPQPNQLGFYTERKSRPPLPKPPKGFCQSFFPSKDLKKLLDLPVHKRKAPLLLNFIPTYKSALPDVPKKKKKILSSPSATTPQVAFSSRADQGLTSDPAEQPSTSASYLISISQRRRRRRTVFTAEMGRQKAVAKDFLANIPDSVDAQSAPTQPKLKTKRIKKAQPEAKVTQIDTEDTLSISKLASSERTTSAAEKRPADAQPSESPKSKKPRSSAITISGSRKQDSHWAPQITLEDKPVRASDSADDINVGVALSTALLLPGHPARSFLLNIIL
ncbi:G-type lectin S-receptor-like serine/threonine-protein kinase SD1-1 [Camellia sinensis]|uniref:G-type lectin S-receptor-like serine/threonine-protein kinase SD1-1 n=1 Tax=Camellia sinensis TaxID=4442 RepID=UPI001036C56C|nr:G-type lectin S-receptor-like serine/threonine-protein kinase SD1-1 [Camellia sinensis]